MGSILNNTPQLYTGLYDFAVDGGAVSTINLQGPPIPARSIITEFFVRVITAPVSGGATTISFDTIDTSVNPNVTTVAALMAATGKASFTLNTVLYAIFPGGAAANAAVWNANGFYVAMSIAVAALTAGKLAWGVRAYTFEL